MLNDIPIKKFAPRIHQLFDEQWFLLTSGDFEKNQFNTMTVSWGFFGILWHKPCAMVVVRPQRYTYEFMEKYDTFTLSSFPEKYHDDLSILGSQSGKDGDKIALTDLHVSKAKRVAAPTFAEAELVIECKKLYFDDLDPKQFLDAAIEENYPKKDYHRAYIGEIVSIRGLEKYKSIE